MNTHNPENKQLSAYQHALDHSTYQDDHMPITPRPEPVLHLCSQCSCSLGNAWILGPVCLPCVKANHRKAVRGY